MSACGGELVTIGQDPIDATANETSSGEGDAAASVDGATPSRDASMGTDAGAADVGTTGLVACGNQFCKAGVEACCITQTGRTCVPDVPNGCNGFATRCDDRSDCPGGQLCCFVPNGGPVPTGTCQSSCSSGVQFCKTTAECVGGGPCVAYTCPFNSVVTACKKPLSACN